MSAGNTSSESEKAPPLKHPASAPSDVRTKLASSGPNMPPPLPLVGWMRVAARARRLRIASHSCLRPPTLRGRHPCRHDRRMTSTTQYSGTAARASAGRSQPIERKEEVARREDPVRGRPTSYSQEAEPIRNRAPRHRPRPDVEAELP